jgi:hypothetical protein
MSVDFCLKYADELLVFFLSAKAITNFFAPSVRVGKAGICEYFPPLHNVKKSFDP